MVKYITTTKDLFELYYTLPGQNIIAFDTEGTSLDPYTNTLLLLSLSFNDTAYVIDVTQVDNELIYNLIMPYLVDALVIGHNLTYDYKALYHWSKQFGKPVELQKMHDTMIIDRCLYAGLKPIGGFSLKALVERRLGIVLNKEIRETFIGWTEGTIFTDDQIAYAGEDTKYLLEIYNQQMQEVVEKKLERIYDLEMSIIAPTAMMEYTGVYVNRKKLESLIEPFQKFVSVANKALQDMVISGGVADEILITKDGYTAVKATSTDQMLEVLNRLGVKVSTLNAKDVIRYDLQNSKGKSGFTEFDYHTVIDDDEVATALTQYTGLYNPYLRALAFFKAARILYSTFVLGLLEAINPVTNRIHPHFNSYGAASTGRYSSTGPNLQNVPQDGKLKVLGLGEYSIRQCFEAAKHRKLVGSDFSGIELTILAVLAGDEKLMYEIIQGDVHTYVAKEVLGCTEITAKNKKEHPYKIWRQGSKRTSYSIAYGTTERNLSEQLNIDMASIGYKITPNQGKSIMNGWYTLFPQAAKYLESNAASAVLKGYVMDVWGRRRQWDRTTFGDKWKRLAAEREGKNMPIQGTSATMTKLAIRLFWERVDRNKARIIITVHDEIVVESTTQYTETAARILKECMEDSIRQTLPSIADKVGQFESLSVTPQISDCYDK
jgi:DNA polymerase I